MGIFLAGYHAAETNVFLHPSEICHIRAILKMLLILKNGLYLVCEWTPESQTTV